MCQWLVNSPQHYCDVIMSAMVSQITGVSIVYSAIYSGAGQRKLQSWPVIGEFPHKIFPFNDVIMKIDSNAKSVSLPWRHDWWWGQWHSGFCHKLTADSRLAPSQWETALLCNDVSHWLSASLEWYLQTYLWHIIVSDSCYREPLHTSQ